MKKYIVVYQLEDIKLRIKIMDNLNLALEFMRTTKRAIMYEAISGISYDDGTWYLEN